MDPSEQAEFHDGFVTVTNDVIIPWLAPYIQQLKSVKNLYIVGHSLGAALAQLTALYLSVVQHLNGVYCVGFASPRVGNAASANLAKLANFRLVNFMTYLDPVVILPPMLFGYVRWGESPVRNTPEGGCFPDLEWPYCDPSAEFPECSAGVTASSIPCCLGAPTQDKAVSNCPADWESNPQNDTEWCITNFNVLESNYYRHKCTRVDTSPVQIPRQSIICIGAADLQDIFGDFVSPAFDWSVLDVAVSNHYLTTYIPYLTALASLFVATPCTYDAHAVHGDKYGMCGGETSQCVSYNGPVNCVLNGWCGAQTNKCVYMQ